MKLQDFPVTPVANISQARLRRVRVIETCFLRVMTALYRDLDACGSIIEPGPLSLEARYLRHRIVDSGDEVIEMAS